MSIPGLQLRNGLLELLCKLPTAEICKVGHEDDGASRLWCRLQCGSRMLVPVPSAQCMGTASTKSRLFNFSSGSASSGLNVLTSQREAIAVETPVLACCTEHPSSAR